MRVRLQLLIQAVLMRMDAIQIERQVNITVTIETSSAPKYHAMFQLVTGMVAAATVDRAIEAIILDNA
jgi:hypothetical protein